MSRDVPTEVESLSTDRCDAPPGYVLVGVLIPESEAPFATLGTSVTLNLPEAKNAS